MMGRVENRRNLGGAIFIHGSSVSAGCLAMSDPVAEEIFTLVARTGLGNASIILSPVDLRRESAPNPLDHDVPVWAAHLYAIIQRALWALPPARIDTRRQSSWARVEHPIEYAPSMSWRRVQGAADSFPSTAMVRGRTALRTL